jgi:hypothetical protein
MCQSGSNAYARGEGFQQIEAFPPIFVAWFRRDMAASTDADKPRAPFIGHLLCDLGRAIRIV